MKTAPFVARTIAYLIDFAIAITAFYVLLMGLMLGMITWMANHGAPLDFIGTGRLPDSLPEFDQVTWIVVLASFAAAVLLFVVIFHGYFVWLEFKRGATYGKRLFGLRVVSLSPDGSTSPITWKQAVGRDFWRYLDVGLIIPALISMVLSSRQERVGDRLCKTWVIVDPKVPSAIRPHS